MEDFLFFARRFPPNLKTLLMLGSWQIALQTFMKGSIYKSGGREAGNRGRSNYFLFG